MKMDVLYLSALCTEEEYKRMFKLYGTTSSHASQKFHRYMVRGLKENGINVFPFSYRAIQKPKLDDLAISSQEENGIHFEYVPHSKYQKLNRVYTIIKTYSYLKRWHKNHKNETTIFLDTINGEFAIAVSLFKAFHKCKTIGLVMDVPAKRANEQRTGVKAIPFIIKNTLIRNHDAYVFLTEKMNSYLNLSNRPYVIIEGIVGNQVAVKNSLENKSTVKTIMMAGLLEKAFGVDELLQAFQEINPIDAQLVFYGKGSSVTLIKTFEEKNSRIHYGGELLNDEILIKETEASLLINPRPPLGEWTAYSFPSKNMEYMASGTPLVAYDLPCIPSEYKNYFYKVHELKDTLEQLLNKKPEELHDFGIAAQRWIINSKNYIIQTKKLAQMIYHL